MEQLLLVVNALSRIQALSVEFQLLNISTLDQLEEVDHVAIDTIDTESWDITTQINTLFT